MDDSSMTGAELQQLYQRKKLTSTEAAFSPREVEEDIQAGKQISQEQMDILNNYWQMAGRQKIAGQPAQQAALQTQENVGFFTKLKNKFSSWFSKKSAQGNAVQEQTPQKFTGKKKEADQIRDRIARRHNPYADHVSYEMTHQFNSYWWQKQNTFDELERQGIHVDKNSNTYTRIFRIYVQGYRTDANGEPATKEDERRKDADIRWQKNYLSEDKDKHNSAIDQVVDDLLKLKLTPAMLKDSYIHSHAAEFLDISNKCLLISDIRTENRDYFKHMDPIKAELIQARVSNFGALFSNTLLQKLVEKGLDQGGQYIDGDKKKLDTFIKNTGETYGPFLKEEKEQNWFAKREQTEKLVANLEKSRKKEEEKARGKLQQGLEEKRSRLRQSGAQISDTALISYVSVMQEIKLTMDVHQPEYTKNKELIDMCLHQLEREFNSCDESELKVMSYAAVGSKMDQLKSRKKLSPEQEKIGKLASAAVSFESRQMNLHLGKGATYRVGIEALLTGEKPSEEFWELLSSTVGQVVTEAMRDRWSNFENR